MTEADGAPSEGWKPWATNARASREAIKSIWSDIHKGAVKNKGKVAVVKVTGSKSVEFGPAVVNVPVLELTGFADRPGDAAVAPAPSSDDDDLF